MSKEEPFDEVAVVSLFSILYDAGADLGPAVFGWTQERANAGYIEGIPEEELQARLTKLIARIHGLATTPAEPAPWYPDDSGNWIAA